MSNTASAGIDAAGMIALPLVIHSDEIATGAINHALRFTAGSAGCGYWPSQITPCSGAPAGPPAGARFRLKNSTYTSLYPLLSSIEKVLADQLAHYGLILADAGYSGQISRSDEFQTATEQAAMVSLNSRLNFQNDFEVVDESSLKLASNSYDTNSPAEMVIATDLVSGHSARVRVNLQGAAIGVFWPYETFLVGAPAKQLQAWVTGASNTEIRWSMSPKLGTLTASGVYTPPASLPNLQSTTITATSSASPRVTATIQIAVLPGGTVRINAGDTTDYTDNSGHLWYGDQVDGRPLLGIAYDGSTYDFGSYGLHSKWTGTSDPSLYDKVAHTTGDIVYRFNVPNGVYRIDLLTAPTDSSSGRLKFSVDSQGAAFLTDYDMYAATGNTLYQAVDIPIVTTVTGGALYFAMRNRAEFKSLPI
jgi:hypothetical protein